MCHHVVGRSSLPSSWLLEHCIRSNPTNPCMYVCMYVSRYKYTVKAVKVYKYIHGFMHCIFFHNIDWISFVVLCTNVCRMHFWIRVSLHVMYCQAMCEYDHNIAQVNMPTYFTLRTPIPTSVTASQLSPINQSTTKNNRIQPNKLEGPGNRFNLNLKVLKGKKHSVKWYFWIYCHLL